MDRPVGPSMFGTPSPEPERIDPPGGFAQMPPSAPDPVEGSNAPMTGDVPPMQTPNTVSRFDPWNYREDAGLGTGADIVGFRVEAMDGHIGKIDEASTIVGDSYLVVDTGPWIFGKKVLLPAGTVKNVDVTDKRVYVDRTKQQIKDSPEFDPDNFREEGYRDKVGGYYTDTYSLGEAVPPLASDTEGSEPTPPRDYPR